jgi:glyoxylase-like metal-dependent hydrolase (beta-lactamase superfamily II)
MSLPEVRDPADWYASDACGDGITHLCEPYINVFYRCNIWHVRGRDRCLLFDSGLGVVSLAKRFPWLLETPLLAVASHTHFDHIGNAHEFAERACHVAEAPILAAPTPANTVADRYATLAMFERLPPGGFDPIRYRVRSAPATRLVEAGDIVDLGDRHFVVIHVPGHSPGSIALWETGSGVLLSGDAVYDGPLVDDAYHSDRADYLDSMRRLRELPVRVVHGGHYPSFGRDRYRELIDEYLAGRRAPGCPSEGSGCGRAPRS